MQRAATVLLYTLALAGCGGNAEPEVDGQASVTPPAPEALPPAPLSETGLTKAEAFRFLNQATFGATEDEAERLMEIGIEAWIEDQLAQPASLELPYVQSLAWLEQPFKLQQDRVDIWFRNALHGHDQLRQRVAFALSEIMVVSQVGALGGAPYALASYYDLLAQHAFGDFRALMEAVTLHPAMGVYLSMLGNRKADPARNIRPDENYARELMQLFTIGLVELEIDGSVKHDGIGEPIPTYDQETIESFARIYTGWHYAGAPSFGQAKRTDDNQVVPMQLYPDFHDTGAKTLLSGFKVPADQPGEQDLDQALDNIFHHPNVGPFIARRLIQRLVTSNPSPEYIKRVARRFNDNGAGTRGDLAAVVKAILLDPEARPTPPTEHSGKLKEPLLRLTQLWRAYDAESASGRYLVGGLSTRLGQGPLQSASVFNFFSPFYAPPGEIRDAGLVAPELEIATEYQNTAVTNLIFGQIFGRNSQRDDLEADDIVIDIDEEIGLAAAPIALVNRVSEKLLGGGISPHLREEVVALVYQIPERNRAARATEAIYLIAASPEFAVQR